MALRSPISHICKHALSSSSSRASAVSHFVCSRHSMPQRRAMATVVPPVTQDATSSKGPTAMVFMNMGGPSTTDEVGDFLSRLFVSRKILRQVFHGYPHPRCPELSSLYRKGRCRSDTPRPSPILPWPPHLPSPHAQNPKAIRSHRGRFPHPQVVRISIFRNVQDPRPNIPANRPP